MTRPAAAMYYVPHNAPRNAPRLRKHGLRYYRRYFQSAMRTVDPELWSRKMKRPAVQASRFGQQQAACGLEARLRDSLWDAADEFWQNCSLAAARCFKLDRHRCDRWWHVSVLLLPLAAGWALLVHGSATRAARPPLVVSLQTDDNSITDYKFPAVALCSNQVIGRSALKNLTTYLYNHPKNKQYGYRESDIAHSLLDLGALLTLALPPAKPHFEQFLRDAVPHFNVTDIMFRLSANCSLMLQRCSWRGELVACERLFTSRLTALGFCCVFNSRYQAADVESEPAVLDMIGQDYGLGVVVTEIRDDFAYVRRPAYGLEMLIFESDEFPLVESGDVRLYPLPRNASLYFNVRASSQLPAHELRYYSEERRGCRLGGGGMSRCLAQCRRDTAEALCGCVPYALQPQHVRARVPTCTLNALGCLNKHREKFMYVFPSDSAHPGLSLELQDALDCPACRVQCRRQRFSSAVSYAFYRGKSRIFRNFLSANLSLVNSTTIRVFYSTDHQEWYRVESFARWSETFVNQGTQWMAITGVSILSYSELLYHGTFRWLHHFIRRTRIADMRSQ